MVRATFDLKNGNNLIAKHNKGNRNATQQLQGYWQNLGAAIWIPFLKRCEETGVSIVGQD